jgi:DNA-binding ferritin-like protein
VVQILTALLAGAYILEAKTRNDRWHGMGPQFSDLHQCFMVDDVAERARALTRSGRGQSVTRAIERRWRR